MPRICPHCHHIRKDDEVAPDWQCPACERAYAKASGDADTLRVSRSTGPVTAPRPGGRGIWLLALVVIGVIAWFWRPAGLAGAMPGGTPATQPEVVLYATSWCGYCAATREFFHANRIEYLEMDIEKSAIAQEGHRNLGGGGVPLIVVGETVVHGYNEVELRRLLRPWLKG